MTEMIEFDSEKAFGMAIKQGFFSLNNKDEIFAGLYMYMWSDNENHYFKHKNSRKYSKFKY